MPEPLKFTWHPKLQHPAIIVGWNVDAGTLGARVTDYLIQKLGGQFFCEIEPVDFFPLGGVSIEDDLVQFPESKFYACQRNDLVIFRSNPPNYEWHRFLNLMLDVAEDYCHAREMHAVGGMVTLAAHTAPREMLCTFNSPEIKKALSQYSLAGGMDYETPPGQRPTLNSFLLWAAKKRSIPAATLWVPIPFYLVSVSDPRAERRVLEFLDQRFNLGLDFGDLDEEIVNHTRILAQVRKESPETDEYITKLESNVRLSAEENQNLAKKIEESFKQKEA